MFLDIIYTIILDEVKYEENLAYIFLVRKGFLCTHL